MSYILKKAFSKLKRDGLAGTMGVIISRLLSALFMQKNGSRKIGSHTLEVCKEYIQDHRENLDYSKLSISWVIPEPFKGSGGHRNIFRIVRGFSERGHNVKVYVDSPNGKFISNTQFSQFVDKNFFRTGAQFILGTDDVGYCDVLIATHWPTAYTVERFRQRCILPYYFIQDYEPFFYEMGYEYIKAFNSYNFGFSHISSGRWCSEKIAEQTGRLCPYFDFPIQKGIYKIRESIKRLNNRIIFFARPDMPRRCYRLGVSALEIVKSKIPECEIMFFGDSAKKYNNIDFEFTNLGVLGGPEELANLYSSATIGLAFSVTNPSLVPYEMMACGLPVVDIDFNHSEISYGGRENAALCEPSPQKIAETICKLLNNPDEAQQYSQNALKFVENMPDEASVVDFVVNTIIDDLRVKCNHLGENPHNDLSSTNMLG